MDSIIVTSARSILTSFNDSALMAKICINLSNIQLQNKDSEGYGLVRCVNTPNPRIFLSHIA